MESNLELKWKLPTTSPVGGWVDGGCVVGRWVGGWTETKLMLSQLKLNLKLELSLAISTSDVKTWQFFVGCINKDIVAHLILRPTV